MIHAEIGNRLVIGSKQAQSATSPQRGAQPHAQAGSSTAGQRSLERSALVEAVTQLTRALNQIAALPPTPALRREEITLQVALITSLIHVKGYAAPDASVAINIEMMPRALFIGRRCSAFSVRTWGNSSLSTRCEFCHATVLEGGLISDYE